MPAAPSPPLFSVRSLRVRPAPGSFDGPVPVLWPQGRVHSGDEPPAAPGMLGTARGRRCQEASTRKGFADPSGNHGRCGTRRPFCRGNRVPMPPSRGLSSEGSGPREGNSYAEEWAGRCASSARACRVARRRLETRNARRWAPDPPVSTEARPTVAARGQARARSAAGYQTAGIRLGNHSWYSARSRPSRSI